jgi:hypothetical protein
LTDPFGRISPEVLETSANHPQYSTANYWKLLISGVCWKRVAALPLDYEYRPMDFRILPTMYKKA